MSTYSGAGVAVDYSCLGRPGGGKQLFPLLAPSGIMRVDHHCRLGVQHITTAATANDAGVREEKLSHTGISLPLPGGTMIQ